MKPPSPPLFSFATTGTSSQIGFQIRVHIRSRTVGIHPHPERRTAEGRQDPLSHTASASPASSTRRSLDGRRSYCASRSLSQKTAPAVRPSPASCSRMLAFAKAFGTPFRWLQRRSRSCKEGKRNDRRGKRETETAPRRHSEPTSARPCRAAMDPAMIFFIPARKESTLRVMTIESPLI